MSIVEWLEMLGGVASRATLVRLTSRAELDRAVGSGDVSRLSRGTYALPAVGDALQAAHRLNGVLCLLSAAQHHGWEVKSAPRRPQVCVPKWRPVTAAARREFEVRFANLLSTQVDGMVTDEETTLRDCLRRLPYDEALVVADSALRHGVGRSLLDAIADNAKGPGAPAIRRVAQAASGRAANQFESVARAISHGVPGLCLLPQVDIVEPGFTGRPDLVDWRLRIVVECDSFEWHGGREALAKDARRYNLLVVNGWLVLRFAWEDVMHDPDYVLEVLTQITALAELLTEVGWAGRTAA